MNIQIGDLKTNATEFMHKGSVVMLVGVFFGFSERALATAVTGRATAFVRGIGSGWPHLLRVPTNLGACADPRSGAVPI